MFHFYMMFVMPQHHKRLDLTDHLELVGCGPTNMTRRHHLVAYMWHVTRTSGIGKQSTSIAGPWAADDHISWKQTTLTGKFLQGPWKVPAQTYGSSSPKK
jgi:hypothetical protein